MWMNEKKHLTNLKKYDINIINILMNNYKQMTFTNKEVLFIVNLLSNIITNLIRSNALKKFEGNDLDYFNNVKDIYYKLNNQITKNIIHKHINND
jgi:hypothetical protein